MKKITVLLLLAILALVMVAPSAVSAYDYSRSVQQPSIGSYIEQPHSRGMIGNDLISAIPITVP